MKTGIIGILNNPATSLNSHSAGMCNIVSKLFDAQILSDKDNWFSYDRLIIYHGPNFTPGSFNVIGGIGQEVEDRLFKLQVALATIPISTLDGFQPSEFVNKRLPDWDFDFPTLKQIDLPHRSNIVIGDSHSLSVWPGPEYGISRNDGMTLFRFLESNRDLSQYYKTILYFGNIDIRFHLASQPNPEQACYDLFSRYIEYAREYNATVVCPLPIENISRKIPGTGQYKGQNYIGSWELRNTFVDIATELIQFSGLSYYKWPDYFKNIFGELDFEYMEPRQSVHLRPKYYKPILCSI